MTRANGEQAFAVNLNTDMASRVKLVQESIQQKEPHRKVHTSEILRLLLTAGLEAVEGQAQ